MRLTRFQRLLDAYGADYARWPAAERPAARALLMRDPRARSALEAARSLDRQLDGFAPTRAPEASACVLHALVSAAERQEGWGSALGDFWFAFRDWPRVATLSAVTLLGLMVGLARSDHLSIGAPRSDVSTLLFEAAPDDWLR